MCIPNLIMLYTCVYLINYAMYVCIPNLIVPSQVNKEAKVHNGRIIECYWDSSSGWNFMKVREDKSFPNGVTTAKSEVTCMWG